MGNVDGVSDHVTDCQILYPEFSTATNSSVIDITTVCVLM